VTLTSRDKINTMLRGVLDDASGKWGIRVTRVEIKAIDPPKSVIDAMEKQMRAEREKRAAILTAEGIRQSQILTADGDKQGTVLRAEGDKQSAILRAEGQAQAIGTVFEAIHDGDPDPKLLAYQYLQTLPQLAQGPGNTVWMIPSELTSALKTLSSAFDGAGGGGDSASAQNGPAPAGRADSSRPAQVAAPAAGYAELLGQAGNAEVLGRAGAAADARHAAAAADVPDLAGLAEVPDLAPPADVLAQAGPVEVPDLVDPAEPPT
jgi:SPFH domain / Band 7 family